MTYDACHKYFTKYNEISSTEVQVYRKCAVMSKPLSKTYHEICYSILFARHKIIVLLILYYLKFGGTNYNQS